MGCCGFPVGQRRYWEVFDTVEIQQTFYSPPRVETVRRWREAAPPEAALALKCWQVITHPPTSPTYRRLREPPPPGPLGHLALSPGTRRAWARMRELLAAAEARWLVLQTPPSFVPPEAPRRLRRFLGAVDRHGIALAWEWRGTWDDQEALALCAELDLVPAVDPFAHPIPPVPTPYLRLHGGPRYAHRFTDAELDALARRLTTLAAREVWCYFNNRTMWEDGQRFQARWVSRRSRRP